GPSPSRGEGGERADKPQASLLPLREKVDRPEGPRRMRGALAANTMQEAQGPPGLNGKPAFRSGFLLGFGGCGERYPSPPALLRLQSPHRGDWRLRHRLEVPQKERGTQEPMNHGLPLLPLREKVAGAKRRS